MMLGKDARVAAEIGIIDGMSISSRRDIAPHVTAELCPSSHHLWNR